ncbi:E3 ubiquitin-protein ligase MARCH8 [Sarcoptes scabiei]|uniref:E3 ubiquitin-protein ligase MARCH8 n=1 Tax=Sarcoptes scabiei TaxID=52283 RepID=A0A132A3N1_SARSC|nr:E3 ubiquitin-protein ligase MARCH8 [Sarcoptes scabiei]KPM05469.1 E3 ubiquitin-protein ligase MARCH8-like protein [Sarcoptes scabiei]
MGKEEPNLGIVDDSPLDDRFDSNKINIITLQMEPELSLQPSSVMTIKQKNKIHQNDFINVINFDDEDDDDGKPICRICHCSNEDVEWIQTQIDNQSTITIDQQPNSTFSIHSKSSQHSEQKRKSKMKSVKSSASTQRQLQTQQPSPPLQSLSCSSFKNLDDPFQLITPCYCTGSLEFVHHKCLQQWIRSSNHKYCELCKYNFNLKRKNRPFYQWECFKMTASEQRKLMFHGCFNLISMICVFWSIYVIAEKASLELTGKLGWKFWIKLLIVIVGFLCGLIFIFFQLKLYVTILKRWKQYNQIVIIENVRKDIIANNVSLDQHTKSAPNVQFESQTIENKQND